jgi:CheY-like chemotaxis protein
MKRPQRIVLIDDSETTNFLNRIIIERAGITEEVVEFPGAEQALAYLKKELSTGQIKPTLIFLDINMPEMDGWDFLEAYGDLVNEGRNDVVIMLSSSVDPVDKTKASAYREISDFRSKPLTKEALQEIVNNYYN